MHGKENTVHVRPGLTLLACAAAAAAGVDGSVTGVSRDRYRSGSHSTPNPGP